MALRFEETMTAFDGLIRPERAAISPIGTAALATVCGVVAAGSYFAQPLESEIARDLAMPASMAGLVVTVGQIGYVFGLLFVGPLGDLVRSRRLLLAVMAVSALSLACAAVAQSGVAFLMACFGIGASAVVVQLLVAMTAAMSPENRRGMGVGTVTGGLLIGILLAWPVATVVSGAIGWRALYALDAAVVGLAAAVLGLGLPDRRPVGARSYRVLVSSLSGLVANTPELRRRAFVQALLFCGFSLFWTAVPLELVQHYHLSPRDFALFGLLGGLGAFIAPLAGRLADRGFGRWVGQAGVVAMVAAFGLALAFHSVWLLAFAAALLDGGVQANLVISQRQLLSMDDATGNRLNSLFVAMFFLGGALGSALAAPLFQLGWSTVAIAGVAAGLLALIASVIRTSPSLKGENNV